MTTTAEKKIRDVKISDIEKQYGVNLGIQSDKKLGDYLKERGYPSLAKLFDDLSNSTKKG